jgi:hypothetical protein
MTLSLDDVRHTAESLTRLWRFFTGRTLRLGWSHVPAAEEVWEVFQGRLLDPVHSRQRCSFESWNVHVLPDVDPPVPDPGRCPGLDCFAFSGHPCLLSLKLDAGGGRLYVVRGIEGYAWEGYNAGGNVYESREVRKWLRELIATFTVADFDDPAEFREELAFALERAVTGVRLPLMPTEAPLPAFSFGELFYAGLEKGLEKVSGPFSAAEKGPDSFLGWLVKPAEAGTPAPSRIIEAWLRAVPMGELPDAAGELAVRWSAVGGTAETLLATLRRMFNDISLSPWTNFADKVLRLLALLEQAGTLSAAQVLDFEGYLLRQIGRHLTAYDLVTFHYRGANYPDALLLDAVLADYLARLEQKPELFAGEIGQARRRALRQAWVVRRRYEGHPVPDVPTSPGENARVYPEGHPRVPEEQLVQPMRRRRHLYDAGPLTARLSPAVRAALRQSLADLEHLDERQELGAAVFLDRPFNGGKALVEPDGTLLLASLAHSAALAGQRLRLLARDLDVAETDVESLASLDLPGLPVDRIRPPLRQGTVSLADAARAGPDFVFRFTLPGSIAALKAMLALAPCEGREHLDGLTGALLLARAARGTGLVVFDETLRPRLEVVPRLEQGYASRRGLEYPRGGFEVVL